MFFVILFLFESLAISYHLSLNCVPLFFFNFPVKEIVFNYIFCFQCLYPVCLCSVFTLFLTVYSILFLYMHHLLMLSVFSSSSWSLRYISIGNISKMLNLLYNRHIFCRYIYRYLHIQTYSLHQLTFALISYVSLYTFSLSHLFDSALFLLLLLCRSIFFPFPSIGKVETGFRAHIEWFIHNFRAHVLPLTYF